MGKLSGEGLPETYTLIGAGKLAHTLAAALSERGLTPGVVVSRTGETAAELAGSYRSVSGTVEAVVGRLSDLVIVSVSDDALESVSDRLAALDVLWTGRTVLHTSGTWTSDRLDALARRGAATGSFHPVQTFTGSGTGGTALALFDGIPWSVEGDEMAEDAAFRLGNLLGAAPFRIRPEAKLLFHAAAVTASNYVVTLLALADELAAAAIGVAGDEKRYLGALATRAVQNAATLGAERALTGPVARGDRRVLEAHLDRLATAAPDMVPIYAALAAETIRLAARSGSLDHETAEFMLDLIRERLDALVDASDDEFHVR